MKLSTFMRRSGLALALTASLAMGAAVVAQDEGKVVYTGITMVGGDIPTLDPSLTETSSSIEILSQMYLGLTAQDEETAELLPGISTGWEVDEETGVFTFHLMENVPWVHYNPDTGEVEQSMDADGNPRYVTANDFVYGWERALSAETASPYNYVLIPYVVGAAEYSAGEAGFEGVGIKAVDDWTLEITAPEAVAFAPAIYGMWMAWPLPSWTIEENGADWTEGGMFDSYGPFALQEWAHDESVTLIKNPFWPGNEVAPQATLDNVVFRFLDPATQLAEYEAGTMDAVAPPTEELPRVMADPVLGAELTIGKGSCTYFVGFDNHEAPFDNAHLRRALSFAIDRQSIVDNVTRGGQIPAQWFSLPGLNAAPTLETNPDLGVHYDVELAQAELALALEDLGLSSAAELPPFTISYNESSGHTAIMTAIQQMWTDNLGVTAQLSPLDPSTYFAGISEEAPMIFRAGWCQDYNDANNFLYDVMRSDSEQNDSGFSNAEFDALVDQARVLTDSDERRELYAQAEDILVNQQAGIAPIYWYTTVQMTKPYVERTFSVIGQEQYADWDVNR
jgi:oligopeptide transport system substrate-binding protein